MAIQQNSGRTPVRPSTDLVSIWETDQNLTSELRVNKGLVSKSGEINGMLFSVHMRGRELGSPYSSGSSENWTLVAESENDAMEPIVPKGCSFAIDQENPVFGNGDVVVAYVVNHAAPYTAGERLMETVAQHSDYFRQYFPERFTTSELVLRQVEKDEKTGLIALKALAPGYPPIFESENVTIEILGRARPDLDGKARRARRGEEIDRLRGYKGRPEPWVSADELAPNLVHQALKLVLSEEIEFAGCITTATLEISDPEGDRRFLRDFREDESTAADGDLSYFPADRLAARMFRSGQLSQELKADAGVSASFTLLIAQELVGADGISELMSNFEPSPLYRKLLAEYREAESRIDEYTGKPKPLSIFCGRMYRAGQLSTMLPLFTRRPN